MRIKSVVSMLLSACILLSMIVLGGCSVSDNSQIFMYKVDKSDILFENNDTNYSHYLKNYKGIKNAVTDIFLSVSNITDFYSDEYLIEENGISYAFIDENSQWVEWEFEVHSSAFYTFGLDYKVLTESVSDIILSVSVDGKLPYKELDGITLFRRWQDDIEKEFETDILGNDIRPTKSQVKTDLYSAFHDEKGYYSDCYGIYLEQGSHCIRLESVKGELLVKNLRLNKPSEYLSYKEYSNNVSSRTFEATKNIVIETEHPLYTNSSSIYAVSDWQNVSTTPNSPTATRLNAIGDINWRHNGEKITWSFEVEEDGYYAVAMRARQDYSEGMSTYRRLYIDDEIPFKEAESLEFKYDFDWQTLVMGGDSPYYIWLNKGIHTMSLEVNPAITSEILLELDSLIKDLNSIYRKIVVVTGTTVDIYQDYALDIKIPNLINSFKDCCNRIRLIGRDIKKLNHSKGSIASVLDEAAVLLDEFIAHPYEIPRGLASYKTNIDDIASLLTNMSQQALLLDKIILVPKGREIPSTEASFYEKLQFSILKYIDSYSIQEKTYANKSINVWVNTGRDQAQIIKQMINNEYEDNSDARIELSIVDTGATLIQAALAGKGPDVAMSIPIETPVNLAMRGGLVDLKKLGIDEIYNNFYPSAWTQLMYDEGIYGVPETQIFDMLFIRDDIFKEIGIKVVPKTWDEFYSCIEKIQNNNLMVGISEINGTNIAVSGAISTFSKFYFQNGATFFNEDFSAVTFNDEIAIKCMDKVCKLYSHYGLDREYDFFNRFRSGEMVMGIAPYNTYNQLVAAAPEISGTWSMHPIPGTVTSDGSINRSQSSSGTASIILKAAYERNVVNESWDFIKWWTGTTVQTEFAERLEGVMGIAARYTPANINTFKSINWSEKEESCLTEQWIEIYNVREIPGNYYISRSLTSAIRNTISNKGSIRFNMEKYTNAINSEIIRKREEFGLQ